MAEARGGRAVGASPAACMHAQGWTEPIGVSRASRLGRSGACRVGLGLLLAWLGCVDVSLALRRPIRRCCVSRELCLYLCLCLCLCSDETWGQERQPVGALSTLAWTTGKEIQRTA
jgi:hypothetical protein